MHGVVCLVAGGPQWAGGTLDPAQEAKAEAYKELGYRPAGMVGVHLTRRSPVHEGTHRSVVTAPCSREPSG